MLLTNCVDVLALPFNYPKSYHHSLQLYSDHEELLHNGTGKEYHFKNRNIDTRNILFETEEDPVVAARQIFVR